MILTEYFFEQHEPTGIDSINENTTDCRPVESYRHKPCRTTTHIIRSKENNSKQLLTNGKFVHWKPQ